MRKNRSSAQTAVRRGAVIVETAFAIPIILLLTIATLDICDGIYLKKKAEIAAYEGARAATAPGSTDVSVQAAVRQYLDSRRISYDDLSSVVTISSAPVFTSNEAVDDQFESVTVAIEIDVESNRRLPLTASSFLLGPQLFAQVTMLREERVVSP